MGNSTAADDSASCMKICVRRVGMEDHINIVKLFQSFDHEKTKPELQNNNPPKSNRSMNKTSLSLAGLRIDDRGGIYLNPLLDSNSGFFKCYVAEEEESGDLIGYILFHNTLEDSNSSINTSAGLDDPMAVIEDLFVKPKYRCRGIATQLWRKVLKSSLDRGCFSCECLLIPENPEGLQFWRHKLGSDRVDQLLQEQHQTKTKGQQQELFVELSKTDMKMLYDNSASS